MTICVRHRTASGDVSSCWEFDSARAVLELVIRQGNAEPLAITVPICAIDRPRFGAFSILRQDGESWKVLPARWTRTHGVHLYIDAPIHPALGMTQIVLSNAPADVDAELTAL